MQYIHELRLYSQYFLKVILTYKESIIYRLFLPAVMIIMQSLNNRGVVNTNNMVLWFSFMLFNGAINTIVETLHLREQGYLKQYHSLVSSDWVFVFSKGVVEFIILNVGTLAILLVCILMNLKDLNSIIQIVPGMFITYVVLFIPIICLLSPILLLPINRRNILLVGVIVPGLMILASFMVQWSDIIMNVPWLTFFNPLMLAGLLMYKLSGYTLTFSWITLLIIMVLYTLIGLVSIRRMRILPMEG